MADTLDARRLAELVTQAAGSATWGERSAQHTTGRVSSSQPQPHPEPFLRRRPRSAMAFTAAKEPPASSTTFTSTRERNRPATSLSVRKQRVSAGTPVPLAAPLPAPHRTASLSSRMRRMLQEREVASESARKASKRKAERRGRRRRCRGAMVAGALCAVVACIQEAAHRKQQQTEDEVEEDAPRPLAGHAGRSLRMLATEVKVARLPADVVEQQRMAPQVLFKPSAAMSIRQIKNADAELNCVPNTFATQHRLDVSPKEHPNTEAESEVKEVLAPLVRDLTLELLQDFFCKNAKVSSQAASGLAQEAYSECGMSPRRLKKHMEIAYPAHGAQFAFIDDWGSAERARRAEVPFVPQTPPVLKVNDLVVDDVTSQTPSPTNCALEEMASCRRLSGNEGTAEVQRGKALQNEGVMLWKMYGGERRWAGEGRCVLHIVDSHMAREEDGYVETSWQTGRTTQYHCSIASAVAASFPGGTISVASGVYTESVTVTHPLYIKSNCASPNQTVTVTSTGRPALSITESGGHTTIEGIKFTSTATTEEGTVRVHSKVAELLHCTVLGVGGSSLVLANGTSALVDHCHISNSGRGCGVNITNKGRPVVRHNTITNCGDCGILIEGAGSLPVIHDNQLVDGRGAGVAYSKRAAGSLRDNVIARNACVGVILEHSANPLICSNNIRANDGGGVRITGPGTRGKLTGNLFEYNSQRDCYINDKARPHLVGNRFAGGIFGVVWAHAGGGVMESCTFENFTAFCCNARDRGHPVCTGNVFRYADSAGGVIVCDEGRIFLQHNTFCGEAAKAVVSYGSHAKLRENMFVNYDDFDRECGTTPATSAPPSTCWSRTGTPSP